MLSALMVCAGLTTAAILAAAPARAADALAPYRALPGTDRGAAILAAARGAILRGFDPTAAGDTLDFDWPGAPCGMVLVLAHGGTTRACVGSLRPLAGTLRESLDRLAARVVAADGRRAPVRQDEMEALRVVVAFTSDGEPVADPMQVRPMREGLLVRTSRGDIAFLPGEAKTVSWALREARRAGVLTSSDDASYLRFDAVVLQERRATPKPEDPVASP